jgi:hypothetical protein
MRRLLFALLGVGLLLGTVLLLRQPDATPPQELLLPDLKAAINDVATIDIVNDGFKFSVERVQNEWVVPAVRSFPADFSQVRARLMGLAEAQIVDLKTSNPDFYPQLFLEDPNRQGAQGTRVTLKAQEKILVDIVIGKQVGEAFYVRTVDGTQTYLVKNIIPFPKTAKEWLTPTLTDIDQERVARVSLSSGVAVERQSPFDLQFVFTGALSGKPLQEPYAADGFGALFSYLQFDDVRPLQEVAALPVRYTAEVTTFDGLHLTLKLAEDKGAFWAVVEARAVAVNTAQIAEKKPANAKRPLALLEPPIVQNEIESLNKIAKKWAFKLQDFKIKRLQETKESVLLGKR